VGIAFLALLLHTLDHLNRLPAFMAKEHNDFVELWELIHVLASGTLDLGHSGASCRSRFHHWGNFVYNLSLLRAAHALRTALSADAFVCIKGRAVLFLHGRTSVHSNGWEARNHIGDSPRFRAFTSARICSIRSRLTLLGIRRA
jgi:hypothetical protein